MIEFIEKILTDLEADCVNIEEQKKKIQDDAQRTFVELETRASQNQAIAAYIKSELEKKLTKDKELEESNTLTFDFPEQSPNNVIDVPVGATKITR